MKVCIVSTTRLDNLYLNEWVNYYKDINVDKIFLLDINKSDEHDPNYILNDDIKNGFVKIYKNINNNIYGFYNYIYCNYKNEYDWFCFFNVDEYLKIYTYKTIQDFLSNNVFNDFDSILVNWRIMSDENLLNYNNKQLKERFTQDAKGCFYYNYYNFHFKSIIKNTLPNLLSYDVNKVNIGKMCDVLGIEIKNEDIVDYRLPNVNEYINLQYYWFKSLQELFDLNILVNKCNNYYEQGSKNLAEYCEKILSLYFTNCSFNYEKFDMINQYINLYNIKKINYDDNEICLE